MCALHDKAFPFLCFTSLSLLVFLWKQARKSLLEWKHILCETSRDFEEERKRCFLQPHKDCVCQEFTLGKRTWSHASNDIACWWSVFQIDLWCVKCFCLKNNSPVLLCGPVLSTDRGDGQVYSVQDTHLRPTLQQRVCAIFLCPTLYHTMLSSVVGLS